MVETSEMCQWVKMVDIELKKKKKKIQIKFNLNCLFLVRLYR